MKDFILYLLLSIIAICLIAIVYYFAKVYNKKETDTLVVDEPDVSKPAPNSKSASTSPFVIPDDVAFDNNNLPYRTSRSTKRRINYGKDFNAYLVKGGTIYHKKNCKKLSGKKVVIKHVYECIADKNKKPCPHCKPRANLHEWYEVKFPNSVFVQAAHSLDSEAIKNPQLSLTDAEYEEHQNTMKA